MSSFRGSQMDVKAMSEQEDRWTVKMIKTRYQCEFVAVHENLLNTIHKSADERNVGLSFVPVQLILSDDLRNLLDSIKQQFGQILI